MNFNLLAPFRGIKVKALTQRQSALQILAYCNQFAESNGRKKIFFSPQAEVDGLTDTEVNWFLIEVTKWVDKRR